MSQDSFSYGTSTIKDLLSTYVDLDFSDEKNRLSSLQERRIAYGNVLEKKNASDAQLLRKINLSSKIVGGISLASLCLGLAITPQFVDGMSPEQIQNFSTNILPNLLTGGFSLAAFGGIGIGIAKFSGSYLDKIRGNVGIEVNAIAGEIRHLDNRRNQVQNYVNDSGIDEIEKRAQSVKGINDSYTKGLYSIIMRSNIDIGSIVLTLYSGAEHFDLLSKIVEDNYRTKLSQNFVLDDEQVSRYDEQIESVISRAMTAAKAKYNGEIERSKQSRDNVASHRDHLVDTNTRNVAIGGNAPTRLTNGTTLRKEPIRATVSSFDSTRYTQLNSRNDDNPLNKKPVRRVDGDSFHNPFDFDNPLNSKNSSGIAIHNIQSGRDIFNGIPTADEIRKSLPSDLDVMRLNREAQALENVRQGRNILDGIPVDDGYRAPSSK